MGSSAPGSSRQRPSRWSPTRRACNYWTQGKERKRVIVPDVVRGKALEHYEAKDGDVSEPTTLTIRCSPR